MDEEILEELFCEWSGKHGWKGYDKMTCDPLTFIAYAEEYNLRATPGYKKISTVADCMMEMRKRGKLAAKKCRSYKSPASGLWHG